MTNMTMTIPLYHMAVIPFAPSSHSICSTNITRELIEVIENQLLYTEQPCLCILDICINFMTEVKANVLLWQQTLVMEELRINNGITICFTCVADVTEIHHDAKLSVN